MASPSPKGCISASSSVSSFAEVAPRYFEHWHDLLDACAEYARVSGWRYAEDDFMRDLDCPQRPGAATRAAAMPVVLDWAERVSRVAARCDYMPESEESEWAQRLLEEFRLCERLVAQEAVYNSMLSTCRALGLLQPGGAAPVSSPADDGCAWQDVSGPLEQIASRLHNFESLLDREPRLKAQRSDRMMQANFVVEFGLAHGLRGHGDATAEGMLRDFLERVKEWGGIDATSTELVKALVLESIPKKDLVRRQLHEAALRWFEENRNTALALGLVLGGLSGLLLAGVAAVARSAPRR